MNPGQLTRLVDAVNAETYADAQALNAQLQAVTSKLPELLSATSSCSDQARRLTQAAAVDLRAFGIAAAEIMRRRSDEHAAEVAKLDRAVTEIAKMTTGTAAQAATWLRVSVVIGLASAALNVGVVAWLLS